MKDIALWIALIRFVVFVYVQHLYSQSILWSTLSICILTFVVMYLTKTSSVVKKLPGFILYLLTNAHLILTTLPRDIRTLSMFAKAFKCRDELNRKCIADTFQTTAESFPEKKAFISTESGKYLTFKEALNIINNVAKLFRKNGYTRGDQVALLMENDIHYVPIWIGLSKIGVVTALINTKLQGFSLDHCLKVTQFKGLIYSGSLQKNLETISICEITASATILLLVFIFTHVTFCTCEFV